MGQVGDMYSRPKDSNATVEVRNHATGKALEGADRQTDRFSAHYTKTTIMLITYYVINIVNYICTCIMEFLQFQVNLIFVLLCFVFL